MTASCTVNECATPVKALGLCEKHYMRQRRTGDATMVRNTNGPANGRWKGDAAKYSAVHNRIHRMLGPARERACLTCPAQADDWAYDHADPNELIDTETGFPYSTEPAHYVPLCKPCHWHLDRRDKAAVTRAAERAVIVPALNGVITA